MDEHVIAYIASLHQLLEANLRDFRFINDSGYWGMHPFTHAVADLEQVAPCPAPQAIADIEVALASVPEPYRQTMTKIDAAMEVARAARNWQAYRRGANPEEGDRLLEAALNEWRNIP